MNVEGVVPTGGHPLRSWGRWTLRLVALLLALFAIQLGLLAFPQPLMSHSVQAGEVTIHYDGGLDTEMNRLAIDVTRRLSGAQLLGPSPRVSVFFVRNQTLYELFARLARVPPEAQGFALSSVGNAFVSAGNVRSLGVRTARSPKYSIWEGDPAHTIAHELAHLQLVDLVGVTRWKELPHWKQEGIPEYIANISSIRADASADLLSRVRILTDGGSWPSPRSWDRVHYEAGLLVEFLIEVEKLAPVEILQDDITRRKTLAGLLTWTEYQGRHKRP